MNVYYSGMIICCFLFSAASLVFQVRDYYQTPQNVGNNGVPGVVNSNAEQEDASSSNAQRGALRLRKKKTHNFGQQEADGQNDEIIKNNGSQDSVAANPNHTKSDSSAQLLKPLNVETEQKPKEKKIKKVVYIMDYDTVVNYDTLRTRRKRR